MPSTEISDRSIEQNSRVLWVLIPALLRDLERILMTRGKRDRVNYPFENGLLFAKGFEALDWSKVL